ncbi:retrovirus-related pol polyprotein from transposon TNT 1-94 [Tanacetum coccineum]
MNELCAKKGIKREFSVARTPQQNGVAERKNRTLIEAARTMLADSLLPIPFWAEVVYTAYYVLNKVLVTKPQNKTPYELLICKSPSISFMRPFGCPLTILNTLDSLGKFDGKSDEGYLLGYSTSSKAFRVYNKRTKRVEENLHINFLEDQPNVAGTGTQDSYVAGSSGKDKGPTQMYKHNMVAFLKKPNESVGFTEVVDFLKGTSLRYALTHNPTIYDSLVKQFWKTTTVRTLANGTLQLVASIDSKEYIITEAFVRSKLQLADAIGIHNLFDAEIYAGLATLGPKSSGWDQFGSTIATALICLSM